MLLSLIGGQTGWRQTAHATVRSSASAGCFDGLLDGRRWADISFVDYDAMRQAGVLTPADEVASYDPSNPKNRSVWHSLKQDRSIIFPFFLDNARSMRVPSSVGIADMRCAVSSRVDSLSVVRLADHAQIGLTNIIGDDPLDTDLDNDVLTVSLWEQPDTDDPDATLDDTDPPASWHQAALAALLRLGALEGVLIPRPDGSRAVAATQRGEGVTVHFVWEVVGATALELEVLAAEAVTASVLSERLDLGAAVIEAQDGLVAIHVPAFDGFRAVRASIALVDPLIAGPPRP